ncbi:MerR family transcriptional regulator [Streptomyces silvisoli]|uniref:MerR family transcriptional regulator n=1 Tax=Streptomyces silvisoli TaxID=3034235 RepID=A0ABT5ZE78_9ACTN|nr:MerR family transcriptional regulator [Streptomyces silvisoli]MDF3288132.1 MerR family transcriptional regulator [Streptomyces silvisoli]
MNDLIGIRDIADQYGLALSTLHYWERRGLITAHRRSGQRYYDADQRYRIALIRLWQSTGLMSLDEIDSVLRGRTSTSDWREIVTDRITAIDNQLEQLRTARGYLNHLLSCPRDNPAAECPELRREIAGNGSSVSHTAHGVALNLG